MHWGTQNDTTSQHPALVPTFNMAPINQFPIAFRENYRIARSMYIHVLKWWCERIARELKAMEKMADTCKFSRYICQLQKQHYRAFAAATADKLGYYNIAHGAGCFVHEQKYKTVFLSGIGSFRLLSLFMVAFTLANKLSTLNKAWVSPHKQDTLITATQNLCVNWSNFKTWFVWIWNRLIS